MNANAKKWLKALRSGKYEQGKNQLAGDNRFCCLGVACEVAIANGVQLKKRIRSDGSIVYNSTSQYLPQSVMKWLGMKTVKGKFTIHHIDNDGWDEHTTLAELNDNYNNFIEIADTIEKYKDQLFTKKI